MYGVMPPARAASPGRASLTRRAGVAGAATMTSRLLGVVREQALAFFFGAGDAMDAYNVAFRIPNLVRDLFAEGAMSAAFVPAFTRELRQGGRARAFRLGNLVLNTLLVTTLTIVVLAIVFADPLVRLLAGDYAGVPGKLALTVRLTSLLLPFLAMVAVAAACMGMLNALHHFFIPSLSPAMFNVATILTVVTLVPVMPALGQPPIMALALGALLGGVGQIALQWPALRREGFRYRPMLDFRDAGLRRVLLLMGPGAIGLAATQVNVFVNTVLATGEGTGAVSWLNYAFRIMYLPIGLFGLSVATAAVPVVSGHAAAGDRRAVRETLADSLSLMLALNVPATCGLLVLATPIVQLLFERAAFTAVDTAATAAALRCYAVGLLGYSIVRIASPVFYAMDRSRVPVAVSAGAVLLNVGLNLVLVEIMGFRGLALGTSLAAVANAGMLLALLGREIEGLEARRVGASLLRVTAATVLMGVTAYAACAAAGAWLPGQGLVVQVLRLGASIGAALAVLAAAARLLRVAELADAFALVAGRGRSRS